MRERAAMARAKQKAAEQKAFAAWTAPIGATVEVTRDDGSVHRSMTLSMPWQLGDGTPVIKVDGIGGGYLLTRVKAVDAESVNGGES